MNLRNPDLLQSKCYINGEWISTESQFSVNNPFDQSEIIGVSAAGETDTEKAIAAAHEAFPAWSKLTANTRSEILRKWFDLIIENEEDLALILTTEQGKPLKEALAEIRYGAAYIEWFAEEAKRVYGDTIPAKSEDQRIIILKQAVGPVAAITPWNFPNAMISRKVAPALAAGCTIVSKPAEDTPLSALALAYLAEQAGIPKGVFNVIPTDDPKTVGSILTEDPRIKKISFTGSTEVGKLLIKQSASTVKKISMELGGNAPFIILNDADMESAAEGLISSKFRNAGQTCVCANRIYVQEDVADQFIELFNGKLQELTVGNGTEGVDIGPMINKAAMDKVESLLSEAVSAGAKIVSGGERSSEHPNCFMPTLVRDANPEMSISREEIFGPIAVVYTFKTDEELLQLANDTQYGLASYFYGKDHSRIWNIAEGLEYGMVGINTGLISNVAAPFGGVKESGMGREGSKYGIEEYLEKKYLCWQL